MLEVADAAQARGAADMSEKWHITGSRIYTGGVDPVVLVISRTFYLNNLFPVFK